MEFEVRNPDGALNGSVVFNWDPRDFQKLIENCPAEPVTPYIHRYIPKQGIVLEAGCGSGRFVYYLAQEGYPIVGMEIGTETVRTLNRMFPHLDIREGDVRALPFGDDSLDGVISLGVIEHVIEGIDGPIREMHRVLKPGCFGIVIVPSFNLIRRMKYRVGLLHVEAALLGLKKVNFVRRLFGKPPAPRAPRGKSPLKQYKRWPLLGDFFEYRFTKGEFERELVNGGFEIVESVPTSLMDGVYHEFGPRFVALRDYTFYANAAGRWLNDTLSKMPFVHNHMHLCVVRKPAKKSPPKLGQQQT